MPSKTDIANIALRKVGGGRITSFTSGQPNANVVEDLYDEVLDDLLAYPWNFATKRVKLAQLSTAPTFGFDHAYSLPSDWAYTISVHGDDEGLVPIMYKHEQIAGANALVSDYDEVWLRYTAKVDDPNLMPPFFRQALAYVLARDLAIPVADSNTLYETLNRDAKRKVAEAKSKDAMTSFPERRPMGSWATSRSGRWYSGHSDWIK